MYWLFVIFALLLTLFKSSDNDSKIYQKVAVILPAFNEEETVANVVSIIKKVEYVDEIIVVDDGSTDNTFIEAKNAGATVISHEVNKGKGEAINTGYKYTDADIIAFIDADIHNLTTKKVDAIIKPILNGKTEITKTKFARESGRVTELTAKPLLNFFFPEISFEQPLSGQFAAKKSALKKINFEPDYGVDVGIVLDADVQGISIEEVDIGEIEHDMSPLNDLNLMANEVVRTIINRANKYGRVVMIDDIGYYIRMAIVGLSLIILGLFTIFFVKFLPLEVGVIIAIIGIAMAVYYLIKVVVKSLDMFKKTPRNNLLKSFVKIHFPVLISAIILILMISTFIGAATFENGVISIEPNSRNLIIYSDDIDNTIAVRGPYTIDSAIENESNILRIPSDALDTLGLSYNDTLLINNQSYIINDTRLDEVSILRLPIEVKQAFDVSDGDVVQDSRLSQTFEGSSVNHNLAQINNTTVYTNFIIDGRNNASALEIILDNQSVKTVSGIFDENQTYSVAFDGNVIGTLDYSNESFSNTSYSFDYNNHNVQIKVINQNNATSTHHFISYEQGNFISIRT